MCRVERSRRLRSGAVEWVGIAAVMLIWVVGRTALAQVALGDASGPVPSRMMVADADPVFEVATIKPSQPNDPTDGFHTRGRHLFEKEPIIWPNGQLMGSFLSNEAHTVSRRSISTCCH
jgi:hypothetical protein